jgi:hypothetical protein
MMVNAFICHQSRTCNVNTEQATKQNKTKRQKENEKEKVVIKQHPKAHNQIQRTKPTEERLKTKFG